MFAVEKKKDPHYRVLQFQTCKYRKLQTLPSNITVIGFGLNPSPPGQRTLYSAENKTDLWAYDSRNIFSTIIFENLQTNQLETLDFTL